MEARISATHFPLETLGPGRRLGIWFQGCSLACAGCMSRHTWDAGGGRPKGISDLLELWEAALREGAQGLTVSGGEPLEQAGALAELLAGASRLRGPARRDRGGSGDMPDLLVYTGYEPAELTPVRRRALRHADALITGRYRAGQPTRLVWRGSANQRLRPLTPLGEARYAPHLARESTGGGLQAVVDTRDGPGVRIYGVPLRGELRRVERGLKEAGVVLRRPSWRP
ncbi:4Fe-4S single cluster domain-containing protein [Streptomyces barkulensis]|uniref:4Fe-4S single cluster domain-containing protein n=1 Tax=Streptomyces barkulensis TaxID=1257026 RepID=UPI000C6D7339|nr:4Fe-4S single cluster domain-containing protein [Streptomyces barkulensis]